MTVGDITTTVNKGRHAGPMSDLFPKMYMITTDLIVHSSNLCQEQNVVGIEKHLLVGR